MARPRSKNPMRTRSLAMPGNLWERIDAEAERLGVSRSELGRLAFKLFLKRVRGTDTPRGKRGTRGAATPEDGPGS